MLPDDLIKERAAIISFLKLLPKHVSLEEAAEMIRNARHFDGELLNRMYLEKTRQKYAAVTEMGNDSENQTVQMLDERCINWKHHLRGITACSNPDCPSLRPRNKFWSGLEELNNLLSEVPNVQGKD